MEIQNILTKLDALFTENKGAEAEKLLEQSIYQAIEEQDDFALLHFLNEMIGYKRETSQVEASFLYAEKALALMEKMELGEDGNGMAGTAGAVTAYATTLLNIANAYRAGGKLAESLDLYGRVLSFYEKYLDRRDMRFASLYNNRALLYQEMGEFRFAKESLLQALSIVKGREETAFEEAVTYANLAATCLSLNEDAEAKDYFAQAIALFEKQNIKDAHYAAALSSMGTYYYKKGAFTEAAECFEKAMAAVREALGENEAYHRLKENLAACRTAAGGQSADSIMTGMELCRAFYETYGKPMLQEKFGEDKDKFAVGLCGEGSDCFGYDDAVSRDHDWGPGFCIWVSEKADAELIKRLKEAYEALPKEFMGYERKNSTQGAGRVGVSSVSGFYERILGKENCHNLTKEVTSADFDWKNIPDEALAAAVNGEVFADGDGSFTAIRRVLQAGFPKSMLYLKLAESCAGFSQAAQYNFPRMKGRGDAVAAALSLTEGLKQAMKLIFYMEGDYPPHEKWLYRGILEKAEYKEAAELIGKLAVENDNTVMEMTERLAAVLSEKLYEKNFVSSTEGYLEAHAAELLRKASYADKTKEELAEIIAETEFDAFDKVRNKGRRASCQNDWYTFSIMRRSQYLTWTPEMLLQYLYEFTAAEKAGRNLIEEKYGRMMASTAPEEYAQIADYFPALSTEQKQVIEAVVQLQVGFMEEFAKEYPHLADNARSIHTSEDNLYNTSYETYLRGEISTYSEKLLLMYGRFVAGLAAGGQNLARLTMENSARLYGYAGLAEAEAKEAEIKAVK